MYDILQNAGITIPFFAHDSNGDPVLSKVDGDFTKIISKNGLGFGAMTVFITEMQDGWYSFPLSAAHADTLGILSITFKATGIQNANLQWRVVSQTTTELIGDNAADLNKIADHVLRRSYNSARTGPDGDAVDFRSLLGSIAKLVNKIDASSGTTVLVYHEDDTTLFETHTITTNSAADPVTIVDPS